MSASPPLPRVARSLSGAEDLAARLREWLAGSRRLLVLTGAGASTDSGIPDYRGPNGSYSKGHKPMTHQETVKLLQSRVRACWWGPRAPKGLKLEGKNEGNLMDGKAIDGTYGKLETSHSIVKQHTRSAKKLMHEGNSGGGGAPTRDLSE